MQLEQGESTVALKDWGLGLVAELLPIARHLDAAHGGNAYVQAVEDAQASLHEPQRLPSARVLQAVEKEHGGSFVAFARAQSQATRRVALDAPMGAETLARFEMLAAQSRAEQKSIEDADTMPFDVYLQEYLSPKRLLVPRALAA